MRTCLSLGAALWLAASAGWAVDWKSLQRQGYCSDFAGVVDPASRAHLEAYGAELERATGTQMALVTIPSLAGEPLDDVARAISRGWGVGHPGKDDGILLLVAIGDRRTRLEIGAGLNPLLPADLDGRVMREMRPALRAQNYGEALMAAADTVGAAVARARKVRLDASLPRHMRPTIANSIPWPFVLFGIGELVLLGSLLFLIPRALGQARGTSSGGGFGSFDSADSFGGFGGGDGSPSGPFGGASSDW